MLGFNVDLKNRLIDMITKGIEIDSGIYRPMDTIDYYETTDIQIKNIYEVLKGKVNFTLHERRIIVGFVKKYDSFRTTIDKEKFINDFYNNTVVIKGVTATNEMKKEKILFLLKNNIPLTYISYYDYLKRIINTLLQEKQR